jgi:hypothetical protein
MRSRITVIVGLFIAGLASAAESPAPCRFLGPLASLPELPEASGIALSSRHPKVFWLHNDSGRPTLFAIGLEGAVRARIRLGVKTIDWEDLAVGACPHGTCLYVADIGDNDGVRDEITIYRVPEPDLRDRTTEGVEAFHATYPDGPRDAEALVAKSASELFVITKGREKEIGVYRFPSPLTPDAAVRLERIGTLDSALVKEMVTGANVSPDGRWAIVRTHRSVLFYRTADLAAGKLQAAERFDLRKLDEPQGEGVALAADGTVYLAGEGRGRGGSFGQISCSLPQ